MNFPASFTCSLKTILTIVAQLTGTRTSIAASITSAYSTLFTSIYYNISMRSPAYLACPPALLDKVLNATVPHDKNPPVPVCDVAVLYYFMVADTVTCTRREWC